MVTKQTNHNTKTQIVQNLKKMDTLQRIQIFA